MNIEQFDSEAKTSGIVAAMDRDGAAVVRDRIGESTIRQITAELGESFDALQEPRSHATLSPDVVFANSDAAVDQVGHARVLEVAASILLRHCSSYQLGTANATQIRAGADTKDLALDAGVYNMRIPGVEWLVTAVWALDDLTTDNGAPTLIRGSHRGDKMRMPEAQDTLAVPMSRGSVLIAMGWILRGWSANRTDQPSTVLVNRYNLGWLRPEVNFCLSLPGAVAESCPGHVRRLLGFESYEHGRLGWYPDESG